MSDNYTLSTDTARDLSDTLGGFLWRQDTSGVDGSGALDSAAWIFVEADISLYTDGVVVASPEGYLYQYTGTPKIWNTATRAFEDSGSGEKVKVILPNNDGAITVGKYYFCLAQGMDGTVDPSMGSSENGFPEDSDGKEVAFIYIVSGGTVGAGGTCLPVVTSVTCNGDGTVSGNIVYLLIPSWIRIFGTSADCTDAGGATAVTVEGGEVE